MRNERYRKNAISVRERHNERKNEVYSNPDVLLEYSRNNVTFKPCEVATYAQQFDRMVEEGVISTRGLKPDAYVFDELVFDVNTDYFESHGGYEYAVRQDAYKLDQRIRQMEFLSKNNIDTLAQLETYRQAKLGEIVQLTAERKSLCKTNPDSSHIQKINTALKQLRQEERLCRKIAEHSLEVQQHLTEARRDRAAQQQREQERARDRRPNIDLTLLP